MYIVAYVALSAPELASVMQRWVEQRGDLGPALRLGAVVVLAPDYRPRTAVSAALLQTGAPGSAAQVAPLLNHPSHLTLQRKMKAVLMEPTSLIVIASAPPSARHSFANWPLSKRFMYIASPVSFLVSKPNHRHRRLGGSALRG